MTNSLLAVFVESLTTDQRQKIIADFEEYEAKCAIGDSELRSLTELFMSQNNIAEHNVTFFMNALAFECFRWFYYSQK